MKQENEKPREEGKERRNSALPKFLSAFFIVLVVLFVLQFVSFKAFLIVGSVMFVGLSAIYIFLIIREIDL